MEVVRRFKEAGAKWEPVTLQKCIDNTEGSGCWKQGTVEQMLKDGITVFTPFAEFRADVTVKKVRSDAINDYFEVRQGDKIDYQTYPCSMDMKTDEIKDEILNP